MNKKGNELVKSIHEFSWRAKYEREFTSEKDKQSEWVLKGEIDITGPWPRSKGMLEQVKMETVLPLSPQWG